MNNDTESHRDAPSLQDEQDGISDTARHIDDALDEALDESFAASDPIAITVAKIPHRQVINMRWIEARRLVKIHSRPSELPEKT